MERFFFVNANLLYQTFLTYTSRIGKVFLLLNTCLCIDMYLIIGRIKEAPKATGNKNVELPPINAISG
ncbi:hypothetical protein THF1C08_50061 [Vibrio jasicida]|uniref:Uncharacterized protein n=1 Tax=Vibrio jasicida TaxID=766224 RepID=A0AAU9QXB4_9VIBR|nr:hypothetical protein THF1C08_50061 [Vibrio jasicida]CAH1601874.1 hypothetical protein THF1A12_50288 [Vibrio jasicida]